MLFSRRFERPAVSLVLINNPSPRRRKELRRAPPHNALLLPPDDMASSSTVHFGELYSSSILSVRIIAAEDGRERLAIKRARDGASGDHSSLFLEFRSQWNIFGHVRGVFKLPVLSVSGPCPWESFNPGLLRISRALLEARGRFRRRWWNN